ncbi:phage terminase large subunit [Neorhizobium galegae]|uniref:phage terminase large subunit n=1 Tax=Neorhizobium galegae TaxID=399 RepID=UPI000622A814|nr:phage terminase large subunit [Neorhizobium galegae]CDZ55094.1 Phage terminase large subunit TerL [Neorhizobium galegae bv. orientalis]
MPRASAVNPKTGKRYGWEEEQRLARQEDVGEIHKQIGLLKRQQKAIEARDRFLPFIKFTSPDPEDPNDIELSKYKDAKHHRAIARVIEEVVAGEIPFLILTMPPRHGKSEQVSRRLPAWFIGKFPAMNGVVATYNDDFAMDFGKDVRSIVQSSQFKQVFPSVRLQRGGAASDFLKTTVGGQWAFVGRGGSLTGRGAHLLIIDDLIKDDKEAQSQAIRDQAWSWFTKVAMSRRMGKKLVIMTFTRWHSDDPIGRLTDPENQHYNAKLAKKIKIINLPAIAEEDDPLGRKPGEPLWPDGPDRFDLDFLEEQQSLDPLGFAALYQQRPSLLDGDLFKRENIRYYAPSELPDELRFYCSSDHAVGIKQRNDPSCFLKVGIDRQNNIYLIECDWRKMKSDVAVEAMLAMAGGNMKPLLWWAEKGHISKSIGPFLRKRMLETGTYINIREVTPAQDKAQRAQSIAGRVAMGKVFFPKDAVWTEKAINQMLGFPNGTHDDFVDALAYIGLGLQSQFGPAKNTEANRRRQEQPKFGTLAWVKLQDSWKREQEARKSAGGF